jgi:hypothetical protein
MLPALPVMVWSSLHQLPISSIAAAQVSARVALMTSSFTVVCPHTDGQHHKDCYQGQLLHQDSASLIGPDTLTKMRG